MVEEIVEKIEGISEEMKVHSKLQEDFLKKKKKICEIWNPQSTILHYYIQCNTILYTILNYIIYNIFIYTIYHISYILYYIQYSYVLSAPLSAQINKQLKLSPSRKGSTMEFSVHEILPYSGVSKGAQSSNSMVELRETQ